MAQSDRPFLALTADSKEEISFSTSESDPRSEWSVSTESMTTVNGPEGAASSFENTAQKVIGMIRTS